VLKLKPTAGLNADLSDITDNPYNVHIKTLPSDKLPEILPEADLAVINVNFAKLSGLDPRKDALILETAQSPYAHVLAVKTSRQNDPAIKLLIEVYHSEEVKKFIEEKYQGAVIAAW
jgi:D-methionine transport system substrate-binding protein